MGQQLVNSVKAVVVVQLFQFFSNAKQFFVDYSRHQSHLVEAVDKLVVTNQVTATRQNVMEWRSCLQFAAQWHQCRLQGAYALWQVGQLRSPPCPASQSYRLRQGCPLSPVDQYIADQEINSEWQALIQLDSRLSVASENLQLVRREGSQCNISVADRQFLEIQVVV